MLETSLAIAPADSFRLRIVLNLRLLDRLSEEEPELQDCPWLLRDMLGKPDDRAPEDVMDADNGPSQQRYGL